MNKKIMAAISMILVFSLLFAFAGCDNSANEEAESTTVITAKTPLPTDITTSFDEENSETVTDTTYSPEQLAANTITIFDYFNVHINELKGVKAKVEMSQSKSLGNVSVKNEITAEELTNLVNTALAEDAAFSGDLNALSAEDLALVEEYAAHEGYIVEKAEDGKTLILKQESLPMSENSYVNAAIKTLDGYMLHTDGASIEYGEDLAAFLPVKGESYVSALTLEDVEKATCVDMDGQRVITVTLKSPALPATIEKAYDMGNVDDVLKEFEKANKYMTVAKPTLTYNDCQIIITANVETDEIHTIEYVKNIDVATEITGQGSLADMGKVPVNFRYSNTVKYTIDRTTPEMETAVAE